MRDLYEVLGVGTGAPDEEIKAAFRHLAKQLHPDLHPGDVEAAQQLQEVTCAYETLSHGPSRLAYDAGLARQLSLRRWRFSAKATTVIVSALAVTLTVTVFSRELREVLLRPVEERPIQLADKTTPAAGLGKAKGVSVQAGDTDPAPEASTQPPSADGPSPKSAALAEAEGSDGRPAPPVEGPSAGRKFTSDTGGAGEREKAAAPPREPGSAWWVVLASYNVSSAAPEIASGVRHTAGAAHLCGSTAFNDLSTKFHGFTPGYIVVVIGPFLIKEDAARSQQQVNACVSGAYLKYARHHGE
jgi:curved DNA-binding protein CbpA